MTNITHKKLVISLIREDLVHQRLLSGLNALGLHADDYSLNLSELIFALMGYTAGEVPDRLYNQYLDLREAMLCTYTSSFAGSFRSEAAQMAERIYNRIAALPQDREKE